MTIKSLLYLSILLLVCSCEKHPKAQSMASMPIPVEDFIVEPKELPAIFEFIGFAESSHQVEIRSRVEGYLQQIAYEEGQLVHKGDLLFQIDPEQFIVKVQRNKADVAKQKAILENAKLTVERLKPLYEKKAASKKDLDNAIAEYLSSEASLDATKAELANSEINLSYTTIRSPVTGLADKARFREGALVSPAGPEGLLTTVSVLDPIWVYFTVSDNDILQARQQSADKSIIFPKYNEYEVEIIQTNDFIYPYKGKVSFSSPSYDQNTGSLLVRAVFPNPNNDLRPGEFVRVKVYGALRPDAIVVPKRALMQKKNGMFVYLIDEENKVIPQDVSTGGWHDEYQIITNGLKAGDRILVDGTNKVRPGSVVQVIRHWIPTTNKSTPTN